MMIHIILYILIILSLVWGRFRFLPLQKNLWAVFGTGNAPSA